ncbi:MAG: TadG family pilus assembly protein [Acidobacteriaceae bacterium]
MKTQFLSRLGRVLRSENAQVLPMMAVLMIGFLGMAAIVMDVGDIYYSYHELQASTNAAAMAAAEALPTSGTQALANAQAYSSQVGSKNAFGNLDVTNFSATLGCVTAAVGASVPCITTNTGTKANAIQVIQTAKVRLYFAALFGHPSMNITATGSALMSSGGGKPFNIVLLIDTTESMKTQDTNCIESQTTSKSGKTTYTYYSRLGCALNGIQGFLAGIYPCAASGCGSATNGVYQNWVDQVSLFNFPEPSSSTQAANDDSCSGNGDPTTTPYTYPSATGTSYQPGTGATYQLTPFMSNYQSVDSSGDSSGTLNTASGSEVSIAAGAESGCGIQVTSHGEGTYYAGAIYAAQAALTAQQAVEANNGVTAQNVMIIVSDGAATSSKTQMSSSATATGVYPSYNNECRQAVTAAQAATAAGTTVYTVAYGSPDTGCTTDTLANGIKSPCSSMQQMASSASTFYSDNDQSGVSTDCSSPNSQGDLADIFQNITTQLSTERLIPNSTFPSS